MAERHSALHGIPGTGSVSGQPGITVRLLRDFGLHQLSHWPDQRRTFAEALREAIGPAPDATPGRATGNGTRWLLPIGPDTYWLLDHDGEPLEALRGQIEAGIGTVGDLGHARVGLRLSGPGVRTVLAKGLAVDLHPRAFTEHGVAVSAIHGIDVVLHLNGPPEQNVFDLYVPRSYAGEFWHWLSDAAAEFGYRVGD